MQPGSAARAIPSCIHGLPSNFFCFMHMGYELQGYGQLLGLGEILQLGRNSESRKQGELK